MEKHIALVTGANRGIGFETCRALATAGLIVLLTAQNTNAGESAAEQLRDTGLSVSFLPLDVSNKKSIEQLVSHIQTTSGRVDVLINNAGVYLDEGNRLLDVPEEQIRETMETNLFGALYMCRAIIPIMQKNNYGRIVNISSDLGSIASMGGATGAYKISKAALNAMTRVLAGEVNSRQIKINTISPGWVRTAMGGPSAPRTPQEAAKVILKYATLGEEGPTGGFFGERGEIDW